MTELLKLPVAEPLARVRMLAANAPPQSADGRRVRWLLGLGDGARRRAAETEALQTAAQAVQRALEALPAAVRERLDALAAQTVELGIAIAREIVGQALDRGAVDPTPTVVRCLRDCVHGAMSADLVVRLHPDDLGLVLDNLARTPELQGAVAAAKLVADASLPRGGVQAETGAGRLRYEPLQALERVAEAVRNAAAGAPA